MQLHCVLLHGLFTEIVRIFDGDSAIKKRSYRTVAVPKSAPAQVLLVSVTENIYHDRNTFPDRIQGCLKNETPNENQKSKLFFCIIFWERF